MSNVTITTSMGKTVVRSPFHPDWPGPARELGGRWSRSEGTWTFDSRDEERVRGLAREVYGTDGTPCPEGTVTVRIPVSDVGGESYQPATLYRLGRNIATRYGRDDRPYLHNGVILVSGGFLPSGGSRQYVRLAPEDDTFVEVRDVLRSVAVEHGAEIVSEDPPQSQESEADQLRAERGELLARVRELEARLCELDPEGEEQRKQQAESASVADITARLEKKYARKKLEEIRELTLTQQALNQERAAEEQREREEDERVRKEALAMPVNCRCGAHTCPPVGASVKAYATLKGRSVQTVVRWCQKGEIPAVRHGGRWYVTADDWVLTAEC
ncbi:helix-turn-helix domain-containing protein [Streptomyces solisilvae]|uniref:helix-turn-helix domain-containing protein n=1 Tax=Streptomyces malaysiensis TaxID=92644 RepID=UPI0036A1E168